VDPKTGASSHPQTSPHTRTPAHSLPRTRNDIGSSPIKSRIR
jgi:hypothetical protein